MRFFSWRTALCFVASLCALACGDDSESKAAEHQNEGGPVDAAARDGATTGDGGTGDATSCDPLTGAQEVITAYGDAWNEKDRTQRDCLLAKSMVADSIYVDPQIDSRDPATLSDHIDGIFQTLPDARLDWKGEPEIRGRDLLAPWTYWIAAGVPPQEGIDYIVLADDGRIAAVHGYWDPFTNGPAIDTVTTYIEAWNASDSAARSAALAQATTETVRYLDGSVDVTNQTALADEMSAQHTDGLAIVTLVTVQRAFSTHARIQIEVGTGAAQTVTATDYVRFDAQGKIEHIGRFFETP